MAFISTLIKQINKDEMKVNKIKAPLWHMIALSSWDKWHKHPYNFLKSGKGVTFIHECLLSISYFYS